MDYYFAVLKKYADFSGRATRSEYWYFVLFNFLISFAISFIGVLGVNSSIVSGLSLLYAVAVIVPAFAVMFRRLHDTNHSGWWWLIAGIPVIGWIIFTVFMVTDSDPAVNKYGPNPKPAVVS